MDWTQLLDNVLITALFTGLGALIGAFATARRQRAESRAIEKKAAADSGRADAETQAIMSETITKRQAADLARMQEVIDALSQKYRELSESTDAEFEELRKKIRKLESERQDYADKAHVLKKDLALANEKIAALELRISDFETQLVEKSAQIAERDMRIEALLIDLERTRSELEKYKQEERKL